MSILYWFLLVTIVAIICGFLSRNLAEKKGHDASTWFACGLFFGIFGLIAAAGLPTARRVTKGFKDCPDCAETVGYRARVCPHCGHGFTVDEDRARLAEALRHEGADVRRSAVADMPAPTDDETLAPFVAALRDPDEGVRFKAIEALAATGKPEAANVLVKMLDGYTETDKHVSTGLQAMGTVAVPYLTNVAANDEAELRRPDGFSRPSRKSTVDTASDY